MQFKPNVVKKKNPYIHKGKFMLKPMQFKPNVVGKKNNLTCLIKVNEQGSAG